MLHDPSLAPGKSFVDFMARPPKDELPKNGKTITMRALERGYYGLRGELADIRQPGDLFEFAIADLEEDSKAKKRGETVTIDGKTYHVPTWMEPAEKEPHELPDLRVRDLTENKPGFHSSRPEDGADDDVL